MARRSLLSIHGLNRLGTAVKFIPRPVTIGFTNAHRASDRLHADQKDFAASRLPVYPVNSFLASR